MYLNRDYPFIYCTHHPLNKTVNLFFDCCLIWHKKFRQLSFNISILSKFFSHFLFSEKRLQSLQPTRMPVDMVAFYAYLSSDTPASVAHHIITFDTVITNVGNAYHPHSGTFIAPRSGLYVFTWTIRLWGNSYFTTELLVNNNDVNWIYFDPAHTIDGSVSSTAVVHVNQGDDVLIRTGPDFHNGNIVSDKNGKSSFAGWIVM